MPAWASSRLSHQKMRGLHCQTYCSSLTGTECVAGRDSRLLPALLFSVSLGAPQHLSLCFPNYEMKAEAGALCGLQGGVGEAITRASLTASFLPPPPCSEGCLPAALVCLQLWAALEPRATPSSRRASFDTGRRARGQFPGQLQTNPKEMGRFYSKARKPLLLPCDRR